MNSDCLKHAERLVPPSYIRLASAARIATENKIRHLIEQRKWPEDGWDDPTIELLVGEFARMDCNNFAGICSAGEREGRVFSQLVSRRHYHLSHGMGRSGDLSESQPKAAGSSLLVKLTNELVLQAIKVSGITSVTACFVSPVATGMSMVLCLLTIRQLRPTSKYILWCRVDQKSAFKCIVTAGFEPVVIENAVVGDELTADVDAIRAKVDELGADTVAAVLSTTSAFAPIGCSRLPDIAVLCKEKGIPHVVNNAYGLQSVTCTKAIQRAQLKGRIDFFVQSTDKNLMVPVGGAIIAGFDAELIASVAKLYPGRASITPTLDVFITLLALGSKGYTEELKKRAEMFECLKKGMENMAAKYGERRLDTPNNTISSGMTLKSLPLEEVTALGSMLFTRNVSGARVVNCKDEKKISGHTFVGWGASHPEFPTPYLTAAASIGITKEEIDSFITRLDKSLAKMKKASGKKEP